MTVSEKTLLRQILYPDTHGTRPAMTVREKTLLHSIRYPDTLEPENPTAMQAVGSALRPGCHTGSQLNTSPDRSSGMKAAFIAGIQCSAIVSGVHPSARCTTRIGRGELNRIISFIRVPNTWPVTPLEASEDRNTAIGAFLSGVFWWIFAPRACFSGVVAGIELVIRLQANGAMQLERTL